jgi:2-polyprenyl-6-methoxyphenol hydroxylase-like FAD-dependent oxidoreductase
MLGQNHVERILHAALAEYGCTVELGTELKSFEQFEDNVQATLQVRGMEQDAQGVEQVASYEYMVGADGARGIVRKQLGLSFLGETRVVENFVVGDIKVDGLLNNVGDMFPSHGLLGDSLYSLALAHVG